MSETASSIRSSADTQCSSVAELTKQLGSARQANLKAVHPAIVQSTKEVFSRMLQWTIEEIAVPERPAESPQITSCCGIVGLSGTARGSVAVNFSAEVAIAATAGFLGTPPSHIDADVVDTVGELTNMIGGSSKDKIPIPNLFLGLPTVIIGREQSVAFDQGVQMDYFRFTTPFGEFTVEIAVTGSNW